MAQISFGVHSSGRLLDATQAQRGLACDCTCPGCGERLLARQGEVKVAHFAHQSTTDCSGGLETALHRAAKQVIVDAQRLNLPDVVMNVSKRHAIFGLFQADARIKDRQAWLIPDAREEVPLANLRADVAGTDTDMGQVAVEIRVTHEVGSNKAAQLVALRVPCVEIDVRDLIGRPLTLAILASEVVERIDNKTWVYHPRWAEHEARLLQQYPAWVQRQEALERERLVYEAARLAEQEKARQRALEMKAARRAAFVRQARRAQEEISATLGMPRERWPYYIKLNDLDGKRPFTVKGDLWRGLLFSAWIHGRTKASLANVPLPSPSAIATRIADNLGSSTYDVGFSIRDATYAVKAYLSYLKKCGMLVEQAGELIVIAERPAKRQVEVSKKSSSEPGQMWVEDWITPWPHPADMLERAEVFATWRHQLRSFDAALFVHQLSALDEEPTVHQLQGLMVRCGGPKTELLDLLVAIGVVRKPGPFRSVGKYRGRSQDNNGP